MSDEVERFVEQLVSASKDVLASLQMFDDAETNFRELVPSIKDRELRLELAIEICSADNGPQIARELYSKLSGNKHKAPLESHPELSESDDEEDTDFNQLSESDDESDDEDFATRLLVEHGIDLNALGRSDLPPKRNMTLTILDVVRARPGIHRKYLADTAGTTTSKASSLLANLKRWGWVYDDKRRWYPTDKKGEPDLRNVRTKLDPRVWEFLRGRNEFQTRELAVHMQRPGSSLSSSLAALSSKGIIKKINKQTWLVDQTLLR